MAFLGYTRISTIHQDDQFQRAVLLKNGISSEHSESLWVSFLVFSEADGCRLG
jgi:hypothetical protein